MPQFAIECKGLKKLYPPDVWALAGVDLQVGEGECFGLLGPNGAGKTTTVEILEGLLQPTAGEVRILGQAWTSDEQTLREKIGISLQETRLQEKLSVRETVRLFRSFYTDGFEPDEVVGLVGLEEKTDTWVGKLSGGQKHRLEIACALVGKPQLLFLDEPTTGLDPSSRRQVWDIIKSLRSEGRAILLTTHYMDEAERLCDRVAIVDRGRIITTGSPPELIASLGGDHMIEFAADEPIVSSQGGIHAQLKGLPGVREVREEKSGLALVVSKPHVTLPPLLELLTQMKYSLSRLTTRHASLEDVFVKLTGRHLDESDA